MKILFLCGSLEPGKDGVGDYTRRLSGELIRKGNEVSIISLCDKHVNNYIDEDQFVENTLVQVSRIPENATLDSKLTFVKKNIKTKCPEFISIQFVPYSYNLKGLPFWLPNFLNKLKGSHKWHIMFHELWIGMNKNSDFKSKCFGFLQKKIVSKTLKILQTSHINTQTNLYQQKISKLGYVADLLPLFSNVLNVSENEVGTIVKKSGEEVVFVLFAGIHFGAPVKSFIKELKNEVQESFRFIFVGSCGDSINEWISVLEIEEISYEVKGFCSNQEVSEILSESSYGVTTTPYLLVQKSGSVAALLEHHLPVICVSRKWEVSGIDSSLSNSTEYIFNFETDKLNDFFKRKNSFSKEKMLSFVTNMMLEDLKRI